MTRTRIAHLIIQPVLVIDDGEELRPGPKLEVVQLTISELEGFVKELQAFIAEQNTELPDGALTTTSL